MKILSLAVLCCVVATPQFIYADDRGLVFPPLDNTKPVPLANAPTARPVPQAALPATQQAPSMRQQPLPAYYPKTYYQNPMPAAYYQNYQQQMPAYRYPQQQGYAYPQQPMPRQGYGGYPQQQTQGYHYPQQQQMPAQYPYSQKQYPAQNYNQTNPYYNNPYGHQRPMRPMPPPQNSGPQRYWPDFYTGYTEDAWDLMLNGPHDMGVMPGGWQFPSISMPEPVGVSDALGSQLPIIAEEIPDMFSFSAPRMDFMP